MRKFIDRLRRGQRGITGLETAIILIGFVVVASVFAFTVLSAGIFSSEKGKEAIHAGLEQARGSMEMVGGVIAKDTDADGNVDQILVTVSNALDGEPINMSTTTDTNSDGLLSDESSKSHTTIVSYHDKNQQYDDITWTKSEVGKGDGDDLLEPGEKMLLTIDLTKVDGATNKLSAYTSFTLEIKPDRGAALVIERTMPAKVDAVVNLN